MAHLTNYMVQVIHWTSDCRLSWGQRQASQLLCSSPLRNINQELHQDALGTTGPSQTKALAPFLCIGCSLWSTTVEHHCKSFFSASATWAKCRKGVRHTPSTFSLFLATTQPQHNGIQTSLASHQINMARRADECWGCCADRPEHNMSLKEIKLTAGTFTFSAFSHSL